MSNKIARVARHGKRNLPCYLIKSLYTRVKDQSHKVFKYQGGTLPAECGLSQRHTSSRCFGQALYCDPLAKQGVLAAGPWVFPQGRSPGTDKHLQRRCSEVPGSPLHSGHSTGISLAFAEEAQDLNAPAMKLHLALQSPAISRASLHLACTVPAGMLVCQRLLLDIFP